MNNLDILRNFPIYGEKEILFDLLNQYELYKETIEKPGDIVILGKNIAIPLLNFANFSEIQTIGDRTRLIYGFDNVITDSRYIRKENYSDILQDSISVYNQDRFVGWKDRIKYHKEENSFEEFLKNNIGIKISLLYCKDIKNQENYIRDFVKPFMLKKSNIVFV